MHKPATLNLTLTRGAYFGPVVITCRDADEAAVDLTGWTVEAQVRKTPGAATLIAELGPVISDAAAGRVTIELDEAATAGLPLGGYGWDLMFTTPAGDRLPPHVVGSVKIQDTYTQPA